MVDVDADADVDSYIPGEIGLPTPTSMSTLTLEQLRSNLVVNVIFFLSEAGLAY